MATVLLFSDAVTSAYKDTSKALKEVELGDKKVVKKTDTKKRFVFDKALCFISK